MKVLIACECSQTVCKEFRRLGHEAYSCDIEMCYAGHPEWHIQGDALGLIDGNIAFLTMDGECHMVDKWDLLIAHPPCTYLTNAGAVRMKVKGEDIIKLIKEKLEKAIQEHEKSISNECEKLNNLLK